MDARRERGIHQDSMVVLLHGRRFIGSCAGDHFAWQFESGERVFCIFIEGPTNAIIMIEKQGRKGRL